MKYLLSNSRTGKWLPWVMFVVVLAGCSKPEHAPDAALSDSELLLVRGKSKARACVGCHGPAGVSRIPSNPSLAGRSQEYLSEQLHAFNNNERSNPIMNSIARNLDDDDIAALSYYFASLPQPPNKNK